MIPFPSDITCAVSAASIGDASLFTHILPTCRPIATRSHHFSVNDKAFKQSEVVKLLQTGVIEPSSSPWRAQVVFVKNPSQPDKKRLCVDYSQTINQYTELDAYLLPRIDDMINNLAHYKVFSTFDIRNAYHQVPILKDDRKYTGFEANGRLYQFRRIPFGVINGVAVFQRLMDNIIKEEKLKDIFPYLDDIIVAGVNQADYDKNVEAFLDVVKRQNLSLNHAKSVISASSINVLGYLVRDGNIRPDPERLRPLKELPLPTNVQSLRRTLGLFAYYAKWIPKLSSKIQSLANAKEFSLSTQAENAFNAVSTELEVASLNPIDEAMPFVVECDASESTISATLNQAGRPVTFMSRTLQGSELHYPAVEK